MWRVELLRIELLLRVEVLLRVELLRIELTLRRNVRRLTGWKGIGRRRRTTRKGRRTGRRHWMRLTLMILTQRPLLKRPWIKHFRNGHTSERIRKATNHKRREATNEGQSTTRHGMRSPQLYQLLDTVCRTIPTLTYLVQHQLQIGSNANRKACS